MQLWCYMSVSRTETEQTAENPTRQEKTPSPLTSDGALLVLVELAFDEAQHQAGLSHGRLSQQHQLKLTDLAARCSAVGPCWSASPCHIAVLKTGRKKEELGGRGCIVDFSLGLSAGGGGLMDLSRM